ncbi:MAG TPA: phosphatase PAP2 family protein [Candidatus Binataceae bacterium]
MKAASHSEAISRKSGISYLPGILWFLAALFLLNMVVIVAASRMPYFPTDVVIARAVQSHLAMSVRWAKLITTTADKPWCFALLGLAFVAAWEISGWRAAVISIPVFFGLWLFGLWLSPIIAQPRPSPELIRVAGNPKGYSFPSIFGLVYVSTLGYVGLLAAIRCRGPLRVVLPLLAILALAAGAIARIVLGAHWPSDLWGAYLLGLFWILALLPVTKSDRPQAGS